MNERPDSAFVTGVSQGIGRALCEALLEAGWRVWGTMRSAASEEELKVLGERFPSHLHVLQFDTSDPAACARACAEVQEPIDVLVNSAASFGDRAFSMDALDAGTMLHTFATNVVGPAVVACTLKPKLLLGHRKLIVMMSTGNASLAGNTAGKMVAYRSSKSALNQLVRSMAAEWGAEGITTVALNPGWVRTRMGGQNAPLSAPLAAQNILSFVRSVKPGHNGKFLNTDGSELPW